MSQKFGTFTVFQISRYWRKVRDNISFLFITHTLWVTHLIDIHILYYGNMIYWSHIFLSFLLLSGTVVIRALSWENRLFAYAKTKKQISFAVTVKLIRAFVFATWIVQYLFFINSKFQASMHYLWLHSPVCVGPGLNPRRRVFSQWGSYNRGTSQKWNLKHSKGMCTCRITPHRLCQNHSNGYIRINIWFDEI